MRTISASGCSSIGSISGVNTRDKSGNACSISEPNRCGWPQCLRRVARGTRLTSSTCRTTTQRLAREHGLGRQLWALGAKGDRPAVLKEILAKLLAMTREEQEPALAELTAFSGILKLDDLLSQKLKEFPMLTVDLKENAVVRPLIEEGRQEGQQEGRRALLLDLLAEKFGAVPAWAAQRVQSASIDQLDQWARKVLHNTTLDDILG